MINDNSFVSTLNNFQENCNKFVDLSVEIGQKNSLDLGTLDNIKSQTSTLSISLSSMKWTIQVLGIGNHRYILEQALYSLNELNKSISAINLKINACKLECVTQLYPLPHNTSLSELKNEVVETIQIANEKLNKVYQEERDLEAHGFEFIEETAFQEDSLGLWYYITPLQNAYINPLRQNLVFSAGKYWNPIPRFASRYTLLSAKDDAKAKDAVIDQMSGQKINTEPDYFKDGIKGTIVDKYNETILVPCKFALDLPRSTQLNLNKESIFIMEKGNPNDAARKIYELFGKAGGERVMNLCTQTSFGHLEEYLIVPSYLPAGALWKTAANNQDIFADKDGPWSKKFPNQELHHAIKDIVYDINYDSQTKTVTVSTTCLFELWALPKKDGGFQRETKGHFIAKIETRLPFDLLNADKFEVANHPHFHVEESLSKLIINNLPEAQELLYKF